MIDIKQKLKEEINNLINKPEYEDIWIALIIADAKTDECLIAGNLCLVCAADTLAEFIEDNNIEHVHMGDDSLSNEKTH